MLRAQVTALDAVRPGPLGREIDAIAREIIDAAGHGDHFGHGLGHGVGLVTHEAPRLARTGETALAAGHVVTVEPGVYLPGVGGVRIEDLVVVTESGRDVLSHTSKELLVVDPRAFMGGHPTDRGSSRGRGRPIPGAMDTRPRTRLLRRAIVVAALGALVVPATADAAKKTKLPVITKVAPKTLNVGDTLVDHRQELPRRQGQEHGHVQA